MTYTFFPISLVKIDIYYFPYQSGKVLTYPFFLTEKTSFWQRNLSLRFGGFFGCFGKFYLNLSYLSNVHCLTSSIIFAKNLTLPFFLILYMLLVSNCISIEAKLLCIVWYHRVQIRLTSIGKCRHQLSVQWTTLKLHNQQWKW